MVHHKNLVMVVRVGGKVLREHDGAVRLPFGSEYTISLKNLSAQRVLISALTIDGQEMLEGYSLVIHGREEATLEGRVKNGEVRAAFKFIQKTEAISENRGDRTDDGIIVVQYQFEALPKPILYVSGPAYLPAPQWSDYVLCNTSSSNTSYSLHNSAPAQCISATSVGTSTPGEEVHTSRSSPCTYTEGITVEGSDRHQNLFYAEHIQNLELAKHTLSLRLLGGTASEPVTTPVYSRVKVKCKSCGNLTSTAHKFCPSCGTRLVSAY